MAIWAQPAIRAVSAPGSTRREPSLKCVSLSHKGSCGEKELRGRAGAGCGTMRAESAALTHYVSYRTPIVWSFKLLSAPPSTDPGR